MKKKKNVPHSPYSRFPSHPAPPTSAKRHLVMLKTCPCGMNNQEAFSLYTMLNMQNSQLPCFIASVSLKPFPHLAHSICHLSHTASLPSSHSAFSCFCCASRILFPSFCLPSSVFMLLRKVFSPSFPPLPLSSVSTCPPQPHSHPRIHPFFPSEPVPLSQYHPRSVKAVPATLCSQYPLI